MAVSVLESEASVTAGKECGLDLDRTLVERAAFAADL
jgi:hypothetical protein